MLINWCVTHRAISLLTRVWQLSDRPPAGCRSTIPPEILRAVASLPQFLFVCFTCTVTVTASSDSPLWFWSTKSSDETDLCLMDFCGRDLLSKQGHREENKAQVFEATFPGCSTQACFHGKLMGLGRLDWLCIKADLCLCARCESYVVGMFISLHM